MVRAGVAELRAAHDELVAARRDGAHRSGNGLARLRHAQAFERFLTAAESVRREVNKERRNQQLTDRELSGTTFAALSNSVDLLYRR
jgi:hypothetical protein